MIRLPVIMTTVYDIVYSFCIVSASMTFKFISFKISKANAFFLLYGSSSIVKLTNLGGLTF